MQDGSRLPSLRFPRRGRRLPAGFQGDADVPDRELTDPRWTAAAKRERRRHIRIIESMKYLPAAFALILAGSAVATAADINFGEVRTRYQVQHELTASERLRPWDAGWRHTTLWQDGRTFRTEFAPRGCYITRPGPTPSRTRLQGLFIW